MKTKVLEAGPIASYSLQGRARHLVIQRKAVLKTQNVISLSVRRNSACQRANLNFGREELRAKIDVSSYRAIQYL